MIVTYMSILEHQTKEVATLLMNNIGKCPYGVCFIAQKFI